MVVPELKARYINVYLPSSDVKLGWEKDAKDAGVSLSKYVYEAVEAFRDKREETPRTDLVKELSEAKDQNQKLQSELRIKDLLVEKLQTDVYKARHESFKEVGIPEGTRPYDKELIKVLRRGKTLEGYTILSELGIDPRDSESVKLVNNQLEALQRFGLVEETAGGWRWIKQ